MPFPNEHACRLKNPDDYKSFRRQNNAASVNGKPVDHIYGIVSDDKSDLQSIRYPVRHWGASDARENCQAKGGSFEVAENKDSTMDDNSELGNLRRVVERLNSSAWAIYPPKLDAIQDVIQRRLNGESIPMRTQDRNGRGVSYLNINDDGIAVLSIMGTIGQRLNVLERISGGVSTEILKEDIGRAIDSPDVKGILLHIDSPGGMVDGTRDLAEFVSQANEVKPVFAYTDGLCCSAAYWIASAASKIYGYSTAQIGSIGVIATHVDYSKRDEKYGIKRSYIYRGKYKTLNPDGHLTDEGREEIQEMVDGIYAMFVEDVSKNREINVEDIVGQESKVYLAGAALEQGLINETSNFGAAYGALREVCGIMEKNEFVTKYPDLHIEIKQDGINGASANDVAEAHPNYVLHWQTEGRTEERKRSSEIRESAFPGQETLVDELISSDVSADEARKRLIVDQKNRTEEKLDKIEKNDIGDLGANPAGDDKLATEMAMTKQGAGDKLDEIAKRYVQTDGFGYAAALDRAEAENPELAKIYKG
jgi:signal peptide peptidase SppA